MTRKELAEFAKHIASRIARKGINSRIVSASEQRRFEELIRRKNEPEDNAAE